MLKNRTFFFTFLDFKKPLEIRTLRGYIMIKSKDVSFNKISFIGIRIIKTVNNKK